MSQQAKITRKTSVDIHAMKGQEQAIVCLTAYTAPMAKVLDDYCDLLLVGDSVGMVLYGMDSTLSVTLDMMIAHTKAVVKSTSKACVILDMPFGSYQESPQQAYRNAARAMAETGCQGIKIEGDMEMAPTVEFLVQRGIPVMGHIGLRPQSFNTMGGYKVQGRGRRPAKKMISEANIIEEAGVFAMVIEAVPHELADDITQAINVPTIGIGASATCDGQILVTEDMIGLTGDDVPKFVKQYADFDDPLHKAVGNYARDVRSRKFPTEEHVYKS